MDESGLDFGTFCDSATTVTDSGVVVSFTDTVGIAVDDDGTGADGTADLLWTNHCICGALANGGGCNDANNVVREAKDNLGNGTGTNGQIGIDETVTMAFSTL